jgi:hypothetical protein
MEESYMKKIGIVVAALGAIAVVLPSMANAETVVIKKGYHHPMDARAEYRGHRDYGWHHGWRHHGDKVVVIKHRHYHD